jgi:hypothetical protein
MPPQDDGARPPDDQFAVIQAQLRDIAERLGHGTDPPDDPIEASSWSMPLNWHALHLGKSIHILRNAVQVLIGIIEQFGDRLDRNANLSQENAQSIAHLTEISRTIEDSARRIEETVGVAIPDQPLFMRDLYRIDTNATEIMLCLATGCEAAVFFAGSEVLLRSALFDAIDEISNKPAIWGLCCTFLFVGSAGAFLSRRRNLRMIAAFWNAIYFGITGGAILLLSPGALGWIFHIIACGLAFWVLARGPARAV